MAELLIVDIKLVCGYMRCGGAVPQVTMFVFNQRTLSCVCHKFTTPIVSTEKETKGEIVGEKNGNYYIKEIDHVLSRGGCTLVLT